MDLKTKVAMEIVKGEGDKKHSYVFSFDYGSPLGQAYDACHEVLARIVEMSQKASENAARKEEEVSKNN